MGSIPYLHLQFSNLGIVNILDNQFTTLQCKVAMRLCMVLAHFRFPFAFSNELILFCSGYFSSVAFPYILQPNYQVPLLAVTFPNVKRNTVITVSCGATNLANAQELRFEISVDTQGKTPG